MRARSHIASISLFAFACLSLCAATVTQAQKYTILDLGSFGYPDQSVPGRYTHSDTYVYGLEQQRSGSR